MSPVWSERQAEAHIASLELFGMSFGLERMRRLMTALGSPQRAFAAVHVVGTNGKSSTTRMTAALLEAHGVRTGAFVSPHLTTFAERIRIGDADLTPEAFAAAVQRAAAAAEKVDRTLAGEERVTQFELLAAAAISELAERGVEVAVVEAGLGGRHDATNVLDAATAVLTNVGLEHTRWLGPTITDIAREKLAVVTRGATLVTGPLHPDAEAEAARTAAATQARRVRVAGEPSFPATNRAVASAAATAALGRPLGADASQRALDGLVVPGRFQSIGARPRTIVDGAHNPDGVAALAATLDADVPERPLVGVVSILDDKDAAGMLALLAARCDVLVCTRAPNPRALPPATLGSLAAQVGWAKTTLIEPDPRAALALAREHAGEAGAVIVTGSIHLVGELLSAPGTRQASAL